MEKDEALFFSKRDRKHSVKTRKAGDQLIITLNKPECDALWIMVGQEDRCHGLLKYFLAADYRGWFLEGTNVSVVDVDQQTWKSEMEGFTSFTESLLKEGLLVLNKGKKASPGDLAAVQRTTTAFQTRQVDKLHRS
jgi:hypothetical protein